MSEGRFESSFADSAVEAFSLRNLILRIISFFVFGVVLSMKEIVQGLDRVGQSGGGVLNYFSALGAAMWSGVGKALGSSWPVISNPGAYVQSSSVGSIAFTIASILLLIGFFYQPISFLINVFDGKRGQATGVPLRLVITLLIVVLASVIVFYASGGDTITSKLGDASADLGDASVDGADADASDDTQPGQELNTSDTSSVIDLLGGDKYG